MSFLCQKHCVDRFLLTLWSGDNLTFLFLYKSADNLFRIKYKLTIWAYFGQQHCIDCFLYGRCIGSHDHVWCILFWIESGDLRILNIIWFKWRFSAKPLPLAYSLEFDESEQILCEQSKLIEWRITTQCLKALELSFRGILSLIITVIVVSCCFSNNNPPLKHSTEVLYGGWARCGAFLCG